MRNWKLEIVIEPLKTKNLAWRFMGIAQIIRNVSGYATSSLPPRRPNTGVRSQPSPLKHALFMKSGQAQRAKAQKYAQDMPPGSTPSIPAGIASYSRASSALRKSPGEAHPSLSPYPKLAISKRTRTGSFWFNSNSGAYFVQLPARIDLFSQQGCWEAGGFAFPLNIQIMLRKNWRIV